MLSLTKLAAHAQFQGAALDKTCLVVAAMCFSQGD